MLMRNARPGTRFTQVVADAGEEGKATAMLRRDIPVRALERSDNRTVRNGTKVQNLHSSRSVKGSHNDSGRAGSTAAVGPSPAASKSL